jgi:hypothetical protein
MTHKNTLMTVTQESEEITENLMSNLPELTCLHYTVKHWTRYLKQSNEYLLSHKGIILADFSQNYSLILQDAVRGFQYANNKAIFYPFIVYMIDQHMQTLSFCIISNGLDQNYNII